MSNKRNFIELLQDLCYIYHDYVKKYDNCKIDVTINNNMIKMILFKDGVWMDEFGLVFGPKERNSYIYISMILMKNLFGTKIIYSKENMFYNEDINVMINVVDEDLFNRMFDMLEFYRDIDFYDKIDKGRRIRNKINRDRMGKLLGERIEITKKLLKVRDK